MNKETIKKEIEAMTREELHAHLKMAMEALEAAGEELEHESTVAQAEAAEAIMKSYRQEAADLVQEMEEADREDEQDRLDEEAEKAGKMPPK